MSATRRAEKLGAFSPFSFSKELFGHPPRPAWDEAHEISDLAEDEIERRAKARFDEMSEVERRAYITYRATNLHETHHFHTYVLTGAGETIVQLFRWFLGENQSVLQRIADNCASDREPFDGVPPVSLGAELQALLGYFMATSLPAGELDGQHGDNPLTFTWKWGRPGGPNGLLPIVKLDDRIYPIGAEMLFEGWTNALMRALIAREFGPTYAQWYDSTKEGEDLWVYGLLERTLVAIFGTAYSSLDPVERHHVCAAVALASLTVKPLPTDLQDESAHPGFVFARLVDFLWATREQYMSSGQVSAPDLVRIIARFISYMDPYSAADHLVHVAETVPEQLDESNLFAFGTGQFYMLASQTIRAYVNNPAVFLDAGEWLVATRRETLPRIPMTAALAPGKSAYHMRFPERHPNEWFMWFLCTQLVLTRAEGVESCPLLDLNVDLGCAVDASCRSMSTLKAKGAACFWNWPSQSDAGP